MSIFKFNSGDTKPSSLKIWTTLIDTPIHPREGYTENQIRYRMFVYLQLTTDFKGAVKYCNDVIDNHTAALASIILSSTVLASCKESDFSDLSVLSQSFPHWVSPELYMPYYLTKMLCHRLEKFELMLSLFDRTTMTTAEIHHMDIDSGYGENNSGLTAYKLYNSTYVDDLLQWVTISYDMGSCAISENIDVINTIRYQLMQSIEVSDNHIIPDNAKTTIPYFKLKESAS